MEYTIDKHPEGVFVFVDDDRDEHMFLKLALSRLKLKNTLVSFYDGTEALHYLGQTQDEIFIIISDVKMPKMGGLELKRMIELIPEIKAKCIPFFFQSNSASDAEVKLAYTMNIQGYLRKTMDVEQTVRNVSCIVNLWTNCVHPKNLL